MAILYRLVNDSVSSSLPVVNQGWIPCCIPLLISWSWIDRSWTTVGQCLREAVQNVLDRGTGWSQKCSVRAAEPIPGMPSAEETGAAAEEGKIVSVA